MALAVAIFRFATLPRGIDFRFVCYEMFSVSGWVVILFGGLMTVAYLGAFDIFGYAFSSARGVEKRKYKDYVQYSEAKAEKRSRGHLYFVPYFAVGAIAVLLSLIFA